MFSYKGMILIKQRGTSKPQLMNELCLNVPLLFLGVIELEPLEVKLAAGQE